jgi:CheY-like chemotaxis protein
MNDIPIAVLLVEDDPEDARVILEALTSSSARPFVVEWVTNLADALARLAKGEFEVVLLDLTLPDGKGLEAFNKMLKAAPNALILVLSAASDEEVVREAMLISNSS